MSDQTIILIAAGAVAFYILLWRRISALSQPMRLTLADEGEALLASGDLDTATRRHVEFMLRSLFSWKLAWVITVLYTPVALQAILRRRQENGKLFKCANSETQKRLGRFNVVCLFVIASNSPLALVLLVLQMLIPIGPAGRSAKLVTDRARDLFNRTDRMVHGVSTH